MVVLDSEKSSNIRKKYMQTFVDTDCDYYINKIRKLTEFSDGLCYVGYLWDCFKKPTIVSESEIFHILKEKKNIYIMWDIHSSDRIFVPNYWKYPKSHVLFSDIWLYEMYNELPEDIYLFDDSFTWSAVYTHEIDRQGNRYCIYLNK